jgi:hypothetical protein
MDRQEGRYKNTQADSRNRQIDTRTDKEVDKKNTLADDRVD